MAEKFGDRTLGESEIIRHAREAVPKNVGGDARGFPQMPARRLTGALIAVAIGGVLGPVMAGTLSDAADARAMFLAAAALSITTLPVILPRFLQERPGPAI